MIEWFTKHCITAVVLSLIFLGIVLSIWEAIPTLLKAVLVIVVIGAIIKALKRE